MVEEDGGWKEKRNEAISFLTSKLWFGSGPELVCACTVLFWPLAEDGGGSEGGEGIIA